MDLIVYKRWKSALCLITFITVVISAARAEVSVNTMIIRSVIAVLAVMALWRVLYQVIATSEEMSRGKGKE